MSTAASIFKALSDPTRREILQELKSGERSAGEIAAQFPISGPSISRHLALLKAAGLIAERRAGNRIFYQLQAETLANTVGDFLSAVCPTQIARRVAKRRKP